MRTHSDSSKRVIKFVIAALIAVTVPVITSVGIAPPAAAIAATVPSFTISSSSEISVAGMPISGYTIDATGGGVITSYSISPAINNGLSFDTATGLISGTPITARSAKAYTITGNNTVGMDSKTFTISVGTRVWTEYVTGSQQWASIVTSSDGTKFAAASSVNGIWFSSDAGVTFETITVQMEEVEGWKSLAASSNLTILHGVSTLNFVHNSNDSGLTWVRVEGPGTGIPAQITSSSDGTKVVLVYQNGLIYTSSDSGATWSALTSENQNWTSVASSSDGTKLVACEFGGRIWTFSDSGASWTEGVSSPLRDWTAVASNSDGTKLVAVNNRANGDFNGDFIWTSSDSGLSWSAQIGSGIKRWKSIASNSDGTKLAALVADGLIQTSRDSGVTWSDGGILGGESIASSSDGNVLATVKNADYIHTSRIVVPKPPAAPSFFISSSSESATVGIPITGYTINSTGGGAIDIYSISPDISTTPGNGLLFNSLTGLISGTPTTTANPVIYTITAQNGTAPDATRTFTISVAPPVILQAPAPEIFGTVGDANFGMNLSVVNGTMPFTFSAIVGVLPPGLALDTNTGLVSGTPSTAGKYIVRFGVVDSDLRSSSLGLEIIIEDANLLVITHSAIQGLVAPISGATPVTSITSDTFFTGTVSWAGSLVDGLFQLGTNYTATITLTPVTSYTTTGLANNFFTVAGATSALITSNGRTGPTTIRVVFPAVAAPVAAPAFNLTSSSETATGGIPITGFTIQSTGGPISSFSISPAPPVWFVFNTSTGALTGSPSESLVPTEYTIRGTNDSGYLEQKFVIEVLDTFQGNVGTAFSLPDEGRAGTPPFVYMANGVLPAGLDLNSSSGLISGIPLAIESRQVCIFITDSLNVQVSQCIAISILAALPPPNGGGGGGGGGGSGGGGGGVTPPAAPVPPVAAPVVTSTATVTPSAAPVETSTATVGGKSTIVPMIVKAKVHLVLTFTGNRSQLSASHLKLLKKLSKQLGTTKVKIAGLRSPTKSGNEYLIAHKRSRAVVKALKKLGPSSDVISTPYYSVVPDACRQSSSKAKKQCVVIFSTGK